MKRPARTIPMQPPPAKWRMDPAVRLSPNDVLGVERRADVIEYDGREVGLPFNVFLPPGMPVYGPANIEEMKARHPQQARDDAQARGQTNDRTRGLFNLLPDAVELAAEATPAPTGEESAHREIAGPRPQPVVVEPTAPAAADPAAGRRDAD